MVNTGEESYLLIQLFHKVTYARSSMPMRLLAEIGFRLGRKAQPLHLHQHYYLGEYLRVFYLSYFVYYTQLISCAEIHDDLVIQFFRIVQGTLSASLVINDRMK